MEPVRAGIQTTDLEFAGRGVHIALHAGLTVLAVGCRAGNGLCTIVNSVFGNTVSITGLRVIGGRHHGVLVEHRRIIRLGSSCGGCRAAGRSGGDL